MLVLALLSQTATAGSPPWGQGSPAVGFAGRTGLPERVLHFPPGRAVGRIRLADETCIIPEVTQEFHPGYVFAPPSQYLGLAQGEARIPAGQCAIVQLAGPGASRQQCLDALKSLGPDDAQDLDFLDPIRPDDAFLLYVPRYSWRVPKAPIYGEFGYGTTGVSRGPCRVEVETIWGPSRSRRTALGLRRIEAAAVNGFWRHVPMLTVFRGYEADSGPGARPTVNGHRR